MLFDYQSQYKSGTPFYTKEIDNYFIDFIPGKLNQLVITFENADQPKRPRLDRMREAWGAEFLVQKGYSVLGIKPKKVDWYRGTDLHVFFRSYSFKIFISSFQQIILYGSSMGGFAALTFADACNDAIIISFNPQSTLNSDLVPWETRYPEGVTQNWTGDFSDAHYGIKKAKKVYIAYDPLFEPDRKHADRLIGNNIVRFKMPLVGHVIMSWMNEAEILSTFLNEALAGTLNETRCQKLSRSRKKSTRYYIVMGLQTRYSSVAKACIKKILTLNNLSAHHQSDFKIIIIKHKLWDLLIEDEWKKALLDLNENILFEIFKSASDYGFSKHALTICNYAIDQNKANWQLYVLAAECHHRLNNLTEGKKRAYEAIDKAPSIGNCYRILARILYDIGEISNALKIGEEGVNVDPNSALGWIDLAKYHKAIGQTNSAQNCAIQANKINPNIPPTI